MESDVLTQDMRQVAQWLVEWPRMRDLVSDLIVQDESHPRRFPRGYERTLMEMDDLVDAMTILLQDVAEDRRAQRGHDEDDPGGG